MASAALVVAAAVYVVPLARQRSQNVALGRLWAGLLKAHPTFSGQRPSPSVDVTFTYAAPTDENLARLRNLYDLDAIAGRGPETERIINLMRWVYRLTGHADEPEIPKELNAFNLIRLARDEGLFWRKPSEVKTAGGSCAASSPARVSRFLISASNTLQVSQSSVFTA